MSAELKDSFLRKGPFPPFVDTVVPNLAARDALLAYNPLYPTFYGIAYGGMIVSVLDNDVTYKLAADLVTWIVIGGGGSSGSTDTSTPATRITSGGAYSQDVDDPNHYILEPTGWLIKNVPFSLPAQDFYVLTATYGRFDLPILKNDGTFEVLQGTDSINPGPPVFNSEDNIPLGFLNVQVEGSENIWKDYFYVIRSDNRKRLTGKYIDDSLTYLLNGPATNETDLFNFIRGSVEAYTYITPYTRYDAELDKRFIQFRFDDDLLTKVYVDYNPVTKLDLMSSINRFYINDLEDEDDITQIHEYINHTNYLRGSVHNLSDRYPTQNIDGYFRRASGNMNSWVGGTGIAAFAGHNPILCEKVGTEIAYYLIGSYNNTTGQWEATIVEYNISTKAYVTYVHPNFRVEASPTGFAWAGNELFVPGWEPDVNKILIYNSTTHVFTESTLTNPQPNDTFGSTFAYNDGTYIWFVGGRGGAPEVDRRCVTRINISTKVFTWMRSIANHYVNFFSTTSHMYLIRHTGFNFVNELERYDYGDNSWHSLASEIIAGAYNPVMYEGKQIPVVGGRATLFYTLANNTDTQMVVIGSLSGTLDTETFTSTEIALSPSYYTGYDLVNGIAYRVFRDKSIASIDLSTSSVTSYTGLIETDTLLTPGTQDYLPAINPISGLLYLSAYDDNTYLTTVIQTSTMTVVNTIFTGRIVFNQSQYFGTRLATLFNAEQPTIFESTTWKSDINIVSSSPFYSTLDYNTLLLNSSFYENYYENLVERLGGIFAQISAIPGSSPLTTKGDLYTYSTLPARLPVGANTFALTADSTQTTGLLWKDLTTVFIPLSGTTAGYPVTGNIEVFASEVSLYFNNSHAYEVSDFDTFVKLNPNQTALQLGVRDNDTSGNEATLTLRGDSGNWTTELRTPAYIQSIDDTNGWNFSQRADTDIRVNMLTGYVAASRISSGETVGLTYQKLFFQRNGFFLSVLPQVTPSAPTADRIQYLPDKGGVFAMLDDTQGTYSKASDPNTGDITNNTFKIYKNTTSGVVKLWMNDGGTLKSVTLA